MPDLDTKIHFYRLTNVSFGILESAEFIRKEIMKLLMLQVRSQQKSFGQRIVGVALMVVAALPVLYELLPEDSGLRGRWLWAVGILGALYLGVTFYQWVGARREEKELSQFLPAGADALKGILAEDSPEFVELQLNAFRTRWQMAAAILSDDPPEPTRSMFLKIQGHWGRRLEDMRSTLLELKSRGALDEERYQQILEWIPKSEAAIGAGGQSGTGA